MVFDMHRHLVVKEWFSDRFWDGLARMTKDAAASLGRPTSLEVIHSRMFPAYYDATGEQHLERMARAGIDRSAIFLFDTGLLTGEPAVPIEEQNRILFEVARRNPEKLVPFAHIDPRRPGAVDFVRRCVEEWGAKGLKLHPSAGFNPEEGPTMALIEAFAEYRLPIITHTGPGPNPTSSRFCDPIYLDRMLLAFPDLKVVAAHMSLGYRQQLCSLAASRPNLYTEISMSQSLARRDYPAFARAVRETVDAFGPDRVLFGSDDPWLEGVMDGREFVTAVRDLAKRAPLDARLSPREVEGLLGLNALRLFDAAPERGGATSGPVVTPHPG